MRESAIEVVLEIYRSERDEKRFDSRHMSYTETLRHLVTEVHNRRTQKYDNSSLLLPVLTV